MPSCVQSITRFITGSDPADKSSHEHNESGMSIELSWTKPQRGKYTGRKPTVCIRDMVGGRHLARNTPTPYANINQLLDALLTRIRANLDANLVGLYVYGSLAAGDFDDATSDIDFVAATSTRLDAQELGQLKAMHEDLAAQWGRWGAHLEGAYLPLSAMRQDDPADARHPFISATTPFGIHELGWDWVINRYVLREKGIILFGPSPATLIDPISPDQLAAAVRHILAKEFRHYLDHPDALRTRAYQAFVMLTLCRALYALEHGDFVSKPQAAAWAEHTLPAEWIPLIQRALAWRDDATVDEAALPETVRFLRFVLDRCEL